MTMLLYSAALTLGLLLSSPWWLLRLATTQRYREGLWERLGLMPKRLFEDPDFALKTVIWIHAVSVGEVLAATRLVAELEVALGEGWCVVVSTTTRTGQALARERFGAERVFYMPLDFGFAVRAYLRALRPAALILMESELWPRMLHECRRAGVPVAVVNARVSDRSFARAMRVKWLWSRVLRGVTLWLAQSEEDARRLVAMGAAAKSVRPIGNLKYDVRVPKESWASDTIRKVAAGRRIVVAGSTLGATTNKLDEERMVLRGWDAVMQANLKALLVVAPRHPDRFESVERQLGGYETVAATYLMNGGRPVDPFASDPFGDERPEVEVVVLDTIGDLAAVYGIADVAFVGGSLVERGGHNPLEPAQFGVPVVMGPSFENFRDIVTRMMEAKAICIVQDEEQLEGVLVGMLKDREASRAMGERGRRVFAQQQGATARAVEAIVAMVKP